jgi:CRP/FNR family transcriptional regulator, cyclic AMP receptor protein
VAKAKKRPFDVSDFLGKMDGGRTLQTFRKDKNVFAQGEPADAVFYIQEGKVKVSVVSQQGKEAVVALHGRLLRRGLLDRPAISLGNRLSDD